MKGFLKTVIACIVGVTIASIFGSIFFIGYIVSSITSMFTSTEEFQTFTPQSNTVYHLNLNSNVTDYINVDPMEEFSNIVNEIEPAKNLQDILTSIEKAQYNDNIKGIYLTSDQYTGSYATSTEIRNKLTEFKATGKFVIAFNNNYTQNQYFLASVADSLLINPIGSIQLSGLSQESMFFKDALDKLGVEMQIFRVGTFKSAVEPFMGNTMSDANKQQISTYLGSMWNNIATNIAEGRNGSISWVNSLADQGIMFESADKLKDSNLFDQMVYPIDIKSYFQKVLNTEDFKFADFDDVLKLPELNSEADGSIAILYAQGEITDTDSEGIYWKETLKEIEKIQDDENIKAVVLRINSPGGSAFASEQIWAAIEKLKKVKPVVTSMGTLAASGGYYIACNSQHIFAEPTTLTGSIGVFGMIPNAQKLITDKLGVHVQEVKTNQFGAMSITKPLTPIEKQMVQKSVEQVYDLFITRCAKGRNMDKDQLLAIAGGRVWSGADALENGLIDQIGGLDDALAYAAKLAYLSSYNTVSYPKEKDILEVLLEDFNENPYVLIKSWMNPETDMIKLIKKQLQAESHIQARMINNITIH